ncbi:MULTISPECIES: ABC transporter permease [Oscillospiraceae]|uniref:ABC transporter permease n=1 Tax=Oscillospiraceae TaxID=216572 RepID=UPI0009A6EC9E|nr:MULTISPECIES: ABC transporter permease [Oscillospiraceae]
MSGRIKELCLGTLLLLSLAAGWLITLQSVGRLERVPATVQLRYREEAFSPRELDEIAGSEAQQGSGALPLTAFGQQEQKKVSTEAPAREAQLTLLWTWGRMDRAMSAPLLSGYYPAAGGDGCVVDESAAYRLWGSRQVTGETLRYDGKDYTVRGVSEAAGGVVLLPAAAEQRVLSTLALEPPPGKDRRAAAEEFRVRHALEEADAILLLGGFNSLGRLLLFLPFLILACVLLWLLLQALWRLRHMPFLFALDLGALVLILVLAFWLSGVRISFPQSMVPTRWSDFEFWQRLFSSWGESLVELLRSEKLIPDLLYWKEWGKAAGGALLSSLAMVLLIKRRAAG